MSPTQREAALRLALETERGVWGAGPRAAAMLRELCDEDQRLRAALQHIAALGLSDFANPLDMALAAVQVAAKALETP